MGSDCRSSLSLQWLGDGLLFLQDLHLFSPILYSLFEFRATAGWPVAFTDLLQRSGFVRRQGSVLSLLIKYPGGPIGNVKQAKLKRAEGVALTAG